MTSLATERLSLRPFGENDFDVLMSLYGDPDVMDIRKIGTQSAVQTKAQLATILDHWKAHGFGLFAVFDKANGGFVGECGLRYLDDTSEVELSYGLRPAFWGRGYATEAAAEMISFGFGPVALDRIVALSRGANTGSHRVLEKLGMTLERRWSNEYGELVKYAIDRDGWRPKGGGA